MAAYFSKRKLKPHEEEEAGELNIVPYLDILMNLIIFMLLSMTGLAAFGILNVSAPNYGGASAAMQQENPDQPKLLLTVLISKQGFYVAGANAVLGSEGGEPGKAPPTVGKKPSGDFDFEGLSAKMEQVKKAFPNETKVIVGAEAEIPYETLIQTMDSIRETPGPNRKLMFSDVTLAAM